MSKDKHDKKLQFICWILVTIPVVSAGIACLANPCLHGICIDDINSTYSCYCIDGYTGVQCQTNWDECWSSPCQNGGTCIDGVASYNCSCPDGFIGDNCETNFNECESNPCLNNGTCIDMTNEYICHCIPGFSGEHCEQDVAVCNSTEEVRCYNGGECIEGPGFKFYCKCLAGWTGTKCEEQIDECQSDPCKNGGICIDVHADYMCACPYGLTGKDCEVQIEFCDEDSCSNNALCVVEDGVRICYCVPDYHGERCELQYDECLLGPRCMNGGTCIDGVDNFTCSCPPRLTGALCECLILDDNSYDCEYVSPTLKPGHNETIIFTSYTDSTTVGSITAVDFTKYNMSVDTTVVTIPETSPWMTSSEPSTVITSVAITTETTSEIITSTNMSKTDESDLTTTKADTTMMETESTTKTDLTTETSITLITQETLEIDNSKTETTTECVDSCVKHNASTINLPPDFTSMLPTETSSSTALTTKPTTESTLIMEETITTIMTKATEKTPETETTTKFLTETTTKSLTETKTTPEIDVVTTTPKDDEHTDKMFTDTPIDVTDYVTSTAFPTEVMETRPGIDTTETYSTIHSECIDFLCNNHGTCINGLHGVRCHCLFNYGGRFCEEEIVIKSAAFDGNSFISHQVKNSTSIAIQFNAKTLITDGQLMHVDIVKGAYMKLFMNSGLLKFEFSCGYQTMLLSELKTYVNKGYLMKIETRLDLYLKENHCNGTLRLNDTVAMSGGQVASLTSLDKNTIIFFGNVPYTNQSDNKPFVGCIKDLIVNGEKRHIFSDASDAAQVTECSSLSCLSSPCLNGGTCSDRGDSFACACANGWMGNYCNQSVCDHNPCQSGGSCIRHPGSGFLCVCPFGKHGIFCEYNVEITRPSLSPISSGISTYVMYPLSSAAINSDRFDLRLRFQTADMDQIALLAYIGQSGRHDSRSQHIALTFVKGYIMLTWNMGSGPRRVFTSRALGARRGGHAVRAWRRGRSAGLVVDGRYNVSGNAPAGRANMTLLPYIYIGGHPSENFRDLPHDLPLHNGWRGCIWEVGGQAVGGAAVGGRGVGQCGVTQCTASSCNAPRGVCIHSPATYGCICNEGWFGATCASNRSPCDSARSQCKGACVITLDDAQCDCPYGKTGLNCDQDLIPMDILFTGTRSYLTLYPRSISSIRGTARVSMDRPVVRSDVAGPVGVVLSMSRWHRVRAGRYGSRLYAWVDGALSTEPMLAHAYPHTASDASLLIGGAKDLSTLPFDVMSGPPESYGGCFRNFQVNNIPIPLEQQNIAEGQNVGACEGAACGAAAGGTPRCRRAACRPQQCGAGRCRRGRCACPAGRAGPRCERHVNVSIPQFDGQALLWATRAANERPAQPVQAPPSRLSLSFTTAEPDGLLLWVTRGNDYIGLGLENGYIKITWSLHCNNLTSKQNTRDYFPIPPKLISSLAQAGFLADGEWHSIVLTFKQYITFTLDQKTYIEEQCFNKQEYEDIDLFIGGITDGDVNAKQFFPQNFRGCMDKISTKEGTILTNYTEVYSENIQSCQLFPTNY
ncbi:unnamed protein product [Euphydryas editha]|uniref:Protein eyes shut n=1 Tax=Euphydryas editha TaxID=104508 RepID=A0AAU9V0R2_EUPED|nr:unnamed protein product [Euphydryas editha]